VQARQLRFPVTRFFISLFISQSRTSLLDYTRFGDPFADCQRRRCRQPSALTRTEHIQGNFKMEALCDEFNKEGKLVQRWCRRAI
jgi:hypothetical protein